MTIKMQERIMQAMNRVWVSIAPDCLVDEGGNPDESATMDAESVAEIVCDADRLTTLGNDEDAAKFYYALDWNDRKTIQQKAFPFRTYGW